MSVPNYYTMNSDLESFYFEEIVSSLQRIYNKVVDSDAKKNLKLLLISLNNLLSINNFSKTDENNCKVWFCSFVVILIFFYIL